MPDSPHSGKDMKTYIAALDELVGDQDPLDIMRRTPDRLRRFFADSDDALLDRPEAPGKWSIRDALAHLFDVELVYAHRIRMALASDNPRFLDMDQNRWAAAHWYGDTPTGVLLGALAAFRTVNLALLDRLTPEQKQRTGVHSKRGEETVSILTVRWAGHDLVHLNQLQRIRAAVK